MGLTIINETVTSLCKTKHGFSDKEKEFVVQFAFRSGDKTLTNQLIDELAACENEQESEKVNESRSRQEEEDEETKEEEQSEQYAPKCTLREPVL